MKLSALKPPDATPADRFDQPIDPDFGMGVADTVAGMRKDVDAVIRFRREAMAHEEELVFLATQLADPALADHPKRGWAERRYAKIFSDQEMALTRMLIHCHHLTNAWQRLTPADRAAHGLDELTGIAAERSDLCGLPLIGTGPIQDAAPIPIGWTYPEGFERRIPAALAISLCISPF